MVEQQTNQHQHPGVWQQPVTAGCRSVCSTGWASLDGQLPEGGWSHQCLYAVTPAPVAESLPVSGGSGHCRYGEQELAMLLPGLLKHCRDSQDSRWVGLIAPPKIAWASRMDQAGIAPGQVLQVHEKAGDPWYPLWALEQALRTGTCAVVFAWLPDLASHEWRRLQLLARQGNTLVVIFQPDGAAAALAADSHQPAASLVRYHYGQPPLAVDLSRLALPPAALSPLH